MARPAGPGHPVERERTKDATRERRGVLRRALLALFGVALCCALALFVFVTRDTPPLLADTSFSTLVRDRDGNLLRVGLSKDGFYRLQTTLDMLPKGAVEAVVHYEDRHFWEHPGVNALSMARAALSMLKGGRVVGGSTITMQVARLKLGLKTGSVKDKLLQILWALRYEWHFEKRDILEAYFSLAPYGGNVEGLGAAALVYFHKEPRALALSEVLSLIPVPQNPVARVPSSTNERFLAAASRLQKAHAAEFSDTAGAGGKGDGTVPAMPHTSLGLALDTASLRVFAPSAMPFLAPHLATGLLREEPGGSDITTTLDPRLQRLVERELSLHVSRLVPFGITNGAALLVHWPTREVLALAGSSDFFAKDTGGQIDATSIRRSPGSTLKPFIYALALQEGRIHPKSLLIDLPRSFAGYEPGNFDGTFRGPLSADQALRLSRNVPAIVLANGLARPGLYGFLRDAGVELVFSEEHYGLSLVLGGGETTMRELATLYCALADRGILRPLVFTKNGIGEAGDARPILTPEAAFTTLSMLTSENPEDTLVTRRGERVPLRIKTGTSNGLRDAWTCGVFGPYVLVVWLGNCDNSPNPLLVGALAALPLFRETALGVLSQPGREAQKDARDWHALPPEETRVLEIDVCVATGDTNLELCPAKESQTRTWFIPGVSPVKDTGYLRKVRVNPKTGNRACPEEMAESVEVVAEFWPSELSQLFAQAGIVKPAHPQYDPACRDREEAAQSAPPRILSPKAGVRYHARGSDPACPIVLKAHADFGTSELFWFLGTDFLGVTRPGEELVARIPAGKHLLRVVDDRGRASVRSLDVARVP